MNKKAICVKVLEVTLHGAHILIVGMFTYYIATAIGCGDAAKEVTVLTCGVAWYDGKVSAHSNALAVYNAFNSHTTKVKG